MHLGYNAIQAALNSGLRRIDLMGRDGSRPLITDSPSPFLYLRHRGDPGAVLYETQKVATVEVIRQSPSNFHRLASTLSTVSATPEWTKSLSR